MYKTDCNVLVKNDNADGSMNFDTCSFDYLSSKFFEITNGAQVFIDNYHIEGAGSSFTSAPITLTGNGSTLVMGLGKLMFNSTTPTYPYLFDIQASTGPDRGGGVFIQTPFLYNVRPTTGILANGNGFISIGTWFSYDVSNNFSVLSNAVNSLIDGGFELSDIVDNWFIITDAGAITSPFIGTNLKLELFNISGLSNGTVFHLDEVLGSKL
ncbi:hypothetical protein [Priestia megaterium]|uniref:hypothetical protein n=1 Tax=Priestia megaterium TaxID=1404 RepID=UPI002867849E|nr:hypothetical protein [Priestia megaterium]MDR7244531.1 hypothetical protein [Priestia megaterium]